ncbi:MAG: dTDP-4-dehydrorhamnose 3,5-epimerase [Rhodospirillales bacterium]|nr:MAG: dTDP-4-dehydrorhamnose 3,5-epimerase [Rhodospirillales bacterium]
MKFTATKIPGVTVVEREARSDERGSFARTYCAREFGAAGLELRVAQTNLSANTRKGTLRGMHYQAHPNPDPKLVSCLRGAIFDVAVDLRPDSPAYRDWFGVELTDSNGLALFVPAGCAHGFLTLRERTEVGYLMGEFYVAELARGVRWNDPAFGIEWPGQPAVISQRDASYPDFVP